MNALRHGLLANTVVLGDEDPEAFRALVGSFLARFQPADDVELGLVEHMAAAWWRQTRSCAVENKIIDAVAAKAAASSAIDRLTHAFTTLASGPELALMHRYETRQSRIFQRALNNLLLLRKQNLPNEPNPISEHSLEQSPYLLPEAKQEPEFNSERVIPAPKPNPSPICLAPPDFPDILGTFRLGQSNSDQSKGNL